MRYKGQEFYFNNLNIASSHYIEGIQLTGYHRLGTVHVSRPIQRHNNGGFSDVANTAHIDTESVKKLAVPKEATLRWVSR